MLRMILPTIKGATENYEGHVMVVVQLYNEVMDALSPREKRLFFDHIRQLDRRIAPGIHKLNWMSKNVKEWFVPTCRNACAEAMKVVTEYKQGMALIQRKCEEIESTSLLELKKNTVYTEAEFVLRQQDHRKRMELLLKNAYQSIKDTVDQLRSRFIESKIADVRIEWRN